MNASFALTLRCAGEETVTVCRPLAADAPLPWFAALDTTRVPPARRVKRTPERAPVRPQRPPMDHTRVMTYVLPQNPYADTARRTSVTVRSARREAELRALVLRILFPIAFVSTGMFLGALIGLLTVHLYS